MELEELRNELLVYIFSFLPTTRDIVKLRYVSLKIRSISETPSLWNNNIMSWPWYDKREERSLNEALEVCGTHVHRLVVPDIVSCCLQCHECDDLASCRFSGLHMEVREEIFIMEPSIAINMLRCCNVTEVTLGICLNGDEVKEIVEKMKHLRKLNICHSKSMPSKSIITAAGCGNLEELVLRCDSFVKVHDVKEYYLSEWVDVGFQPPNLNIVLHKAAYEFSLLEMLQQWPQWSGQIPAGHTAYFKLYSLKYNLWNTSSAAHVVLQLDFGQTATYPFVKASNFELFGFGKDLLLLTNSSNNGKVVCEASVIKSSEFSFCTSKLCSNVSSLSFVTDFTAMGCGLLSGHLEQLSVVCPNLERLDLRGNTKCLESLQGLRNIVDHCHNLQRLNLDNITKMESCVGLWEVLSETKSLNHLRIEICTMKPFIETDMCSQHNFAQLALKFINLKQLELMGQCDGQAPCIPDSDESLQAYPVLLAHFPSLVGYVQHTRNAQHTRNTQQARNAQHTRNAQHIVDIITKCKHLKYFKFYYRGNTQLLSAAPNKHL